MDISGLRPTIGERCYRLLLRLYSRELRDQATEEMTMTYRLMASQVSGLTSAVSMWLALGLLYRSLRQDYYGGWRYDFGPAVLRSAGETLARRFGRAAESLALLELNLEFHPQYAPTLVTMAQVQANLLRDFEAAATSLERALEIDPDNAQAARGLEQVEQMIQGGNP